MKRYAATLALLGLAAVLGLYLVLVENPRERAESEQRERESRVVALDEREITAIDLATAKGRLVLERGEGEAWRVTVPINAPADEGTVRRMLTQLTTLSVIRPVEGIEDLSAVGLAEPAVRVVARHAKGETAVAFGADNPTGAGVYVRRDDQQVFLTTAAAKSTFELTLSDVRRKEFLEFDPQAVTKVTITASGRALRVDRREAGWVLEDPPRPADPDKVASLLSRLRALRATAFFDTPDQRAAVRLDPAARVRIELTAGDRPVRVAFHGARDGGLYAKTGQDELYRVAENLLAEMPLDASALREMRLARVASEDVRDLEVELPTGGYRVTRKANAWEVNGHPLAAPASDRIDELIRAVAALKGDSVAAESLSGVPPTAFDKPAARLRLRGEDDRLLATVTVGARVGERRYAHADAQGPVFMVKGDVVDQIPDRASLDRESKPSP